METYTQGMLRADALQGKRIMVTGGATGLGKSMAKYFLELGAKVMIVSRKEEVLQQTVKELSEATGGEVIYKVVDVRQYDQIESSFELAVEKWGGIDVVVNNAAGNFISPTERLSHKGFDIVVDIVLKGTYYTSLAAGKYWIANKIKGTFLNIVTTYSFTGSGYVVPSATAKAGVLALTRSLAVEWAKYGIRSNAIAPGPFPTDGAFSRLFPEKVQQIATPEERIPLKRNGHHQELANLAAYLVSDFSAYMNGEVVVIDGGEWLKGAGEFNFLDQLDASDWDEVEKQVRGANKK
jgi:NAD(P)-dependent dehydrogenase (short-subunit alcohol dehydrogenase family)